MTIYVYQVIHLYIHIIRIYIYIYMYHICIYIYIQCNICIYIYTIIYIYIDYRHILLIDAVVDQPQASPSTSPDDLHGQRSGQGGAAGTQNLLQMVVEIRIMVATHIFNHYLLIMNG